MKRWFLIGALGIVGTFGALGFLGENSVLDMIRLRGLLANLQTENRALEKRQLELRSEINHLGDAQYLEFLAREQLGLMRTNEVFILLETPSAQ